MDKYILLNSSFEHFYRTLTLLCSLSVLPQEIWMVLIRLLGIPLPKKRISSYNHLLIRMQRDRLCSMREKTWMDANEKTFVEMTRVREEHHVRLTRMMAFLKRYAPKWCGDNLGKRYPRHYIVSVEI